MGLAALFFGVVLIIIIFAIYSSMAAKKKQRLQKEARELAIEKYRQQLIAKYGDDIGMKLFKGQYFVGMTTMQLVDSKGKPTNIETEVMKTKTKLTYIYGNKSSGDVFVFENDLLIRFKDR